MNQRDFSRLFLLVLIVGGSLCGCVPEDGSLKKSSRDHSLQEIPLPTVDAGDDTIVWWDKTHTLKQVGKVEGVYDKVLWSCPANGDVQFRNPTAYETTVIFPRSGYYVLQLTAMSHERSVSDTIVVNVFQAGAYTQRLADVIALMTLDEKISQVSHRAASIERLGIPKYNYWNEALHGVVSDGVTSFPSPIALGATWGPDLIFRLATIISDEARIKHHTMGKGLTYWSPTVNMARDPRWGRNEESFGEDPYHVAQMVVAFVKGLQGDDPNYLKTVSTPKHFIANNEEVRRHTGSSDVDMRNLFEYYMPAFKAAVTQGRAYSVMGAYNALNGVPCSGNAWLLTHVLRDTWGFEGYVVSDCGAIRDIHTGHHYVDTGEQAAAMGMRAGCDLNCGRYYRRFLKEAITKGLLDEQALDVALTRVLSARFRLGEFDPSETVPYASIPKDKLDCQAHREVALEAAHKSLVLLKNNDILPFDVTKMKTIAVVGPLADRCILGLYSGRPNLRISVLDGIRNKVAGRDITVLSARGSHIGGKVLNPIAPEFLFLPDNTTKNGVQAQYYNNKELQGEPVLKRIDKNIQFFWSNGSPDPLVHPDAFSARWACRLVPPETRTYQIGTRADNGTRLYLDGRLLIDNWSGRGLRPRAVSVDLVGGQSYEVVLEYHENAGNAVAQLQWDHNMTFYEDAVAVAQKSDMVVVCVGTTPELSSEGDDRDDIELPAVQQLLVEKILEVNQHTVVVLINGGPVAFGASVQQAPAILEAWYAGQAQGQAIANALFGDINPGGKLPQTFYASSDQLGDFADYDVIHGQKTYRYFEGQPLYAFGHGLSYTSFMYANLTIKPKTVDPNDRIEIVFDVTNTGERVGDEVVQVYVRDVQASVKVPKRQLQRFQRISLTPGQTQQVSFTLAVSELGFYTVKNNSIQVEAGTFEIMIGSSSADIRLKEDFRVE